MPMNLIQQQQALRDLPDNALQQAMQGGIAPPYLVLAEINRRKDARERYSAAAQKFAQKTVADDTLQGFAQATQAAGGQLSADLSGIAAAAPQMGGAAPEQMGGLDAAMPAFANGGMVQSFANGGTPMSLMTGSSLLPLSTPSASAAASAALPLSSAMSNFSYNYPGFSDPYAKLREMYAKQIEQLPEQRDRARAMALIAAGTGMMQGGPNTLANIGAAVNPALEGYQKQIDSLSQQERDLLSGQATLDVDMANASEAQKEKFRGSPEGRAQLAGALGLEPGTPEYERFVALNEMPAVKRRPLIAVEGRDKLGNNIIAYRDDIENKFYDANGALLEGFTPLTSSEIAGLKKEAGQQFTERDVKTQALRIMDNDAEISQELARIDKVAQIARDNNVTGWSNLTAVVPGAQRDFNALLESIGANEAFRQIREMKQAAQASGSSGTGLGPVAVPEFEALRNSVGNLSGTQSKQALLDQLENIKRDYARLIAARDREFRVLFGDKAKQIAEKDPTFNNEVFSRLTVFNNVGGGTGGGSTTLTPDPLGRRSTAPTAPAGPQGTGALDPNNPNDPRNFLALPR